MPAIIDKSEDGMPWGTYTVTYYRVTLEGEVTRLASGDSNVSHGYVDNMCRRLMPHEVLSARCESQPGGLTAYGSEHARKHFLRVEGAQRE